jgi:hypothetical protein
MAYQTASMLAMLGLVASVMLWWSRACYTESLANFSGVSGFNFEVSMTDCWHNPETGVFVSRPGQSGKTLLFLYHSVEVPAITSVDERTIQIALGNVNSIFCRKDRWQDLTIKYDIRNIRYPGSRREC